MTPATIIREAQSEGVRLAAFHFWSHQGDRRRRGGESVAGRDPRTQGGNH